MNTTDTISKSWKEGVCNIPGIKTERVELLNKIGGEPLLKELFRTALDNMLKRSEEIRNALTVCDMEMIGRAAHSIKSSAGNIGMDSLMLLARDVENADSLNPEQIDELLKKIHILKGHIEKLFEKELM